MTRFTVTMRNMEGKALNQEVTGESRVAVISRLRERGYFVTSIKERRKELVLFEKRIKAGEIAVFARQFATMIGAGVPLVRCLLILGQQCQNPRLRATIEKLRADVESGASLSKALESHPRIFTRLFGSLVRAGEAGGILDEILSRLADYLESAEQLRQKVTGALTYPAVIFVVACGVVGFLVTFVIPSFEAVFSEMEGDAPLPMPTRVLLGLSGFLNSSPLLPLLLLIAAGLYGIRRWFATDAGRRFLDVNLLKLPALGEMLRKVAVARFTRTLGTLVASGVPILQALEVTSETSGNTAIAAAVDRTRASVREGESIAEPLKASGVFPPMVVQMIAVGEETGELDAMLTKVADFYDNEVDTAIKGLTSIIEPVVIVFMGVVIGGIVMAVFMPLLDMINRT